MSDQSAVQTRAPSEIAYTLAKNTFFIAFAGVTLKAIGFLFSVYVVRRLGDDRFGQYSVVLAFVGLFQIFAELGMSQYVMREIAQDYRKAEHFFWNLVTLRFLLGLLGMVFIPLGAVAAGYSAELVTGIVIYSASFVLSAFAIPLSAVLMAHERFDYLALVHVSGQVTFVIFGAFFLMSGLSFVWLIVASLLSIVFEASLAIWAIRRHRLARLAFQVNPQIWPRLIRAGLPFGIISLSLTIAYSIDTVMLSMFQPHEVVGWYNVAYNLVRSLMLFFISFSIAIVPTLSRTYVSDAAQVERWYHRSVKFILILSLPMAVGGMLVAFPLIRFLYTDDFTPAALALQILIWDVPLLMFNSFCGDMTTVISQERAAARIYSINALANILLNLYAIPQFGLVGAALVTVVTDLIGALQFHFLLRRKLRLPSMVSVFGRVLIASLLMGLAVGLASSLNLFWLIGLGMAVYGGLVLALRLLDRTEWAMIFRVLLRRVRPAKEAI
jgi:O-antigen/teichoic acid export membrane protein